MTKLSPAAQAVFNAYLDNCDGAYNKEWYKGDLVMIAAALRAAADQPVDFDAPFSVVDDWEKIKGSCASFYAAAEWGYKQALKKQREIAAELEAE